jgi:hypothetical protein
VRRFRVCELIPSRATGIVYDVSVVISHDVVVRYDSSRASREITEDGEILPHNPSYFVKQPLGTLLHAQLSLQLHDLAYFLQTLLSLSNPLNGQEGRYCASFPGTDVADTNVDGHGILGTSLRSMRLTKNCIQRCAHGCGNAMNTKVKFLLGKERARLCDQQGVETIA